MKQVMDAVPAPTQLTFPDKWVGKNDPIKLLEMKRGHFSPIDPDAALNESVAFVLQKVNTLVEDTSVRLEWVRIFNEKLIAGVSNQNLPPKGAKKPPQPVQAISGWTRKLG